MTQIFIHIVEYRLRYLDVEYSCNKLGIPLIEVLLYNLEEWLKKKSKEWSIYLKKEIDVQFAMTIGLIMSVQKAIELGHDKFTTTLLISPKKSQEKLEIIGNNLFKKTGVEFIFRDYRKRKWWRIRRTSCKENSLYTKLLWLFIWFNGSKRTSKKDYGWDV